MTQTAVEWLYSQLWEIHKDKLTWNLIYEQAKQMEKEQSKAATLPNQTESQAIHELSDEEIEKWVASTPYYGHCTPEYKEGIEDGAKWYREQLKSKQ